MRLEHAVMPDGSPCPAVMTEDELVRFLRIPEVSKGNHGFVVANLRRIKDLPCFYISNKCLYPLGAILDWLEEQQRPRRRR